VPFVLSAVMPEDSVLIARYLAGDERGFEAFYARHRRAVYVYLLAFVRNRAVAEELLQETFITLLRQLGRLHGRADLRSCLLRIARSRAIDFLRKERREDRALRERYTDPLLRPRVDGAAVGHGTGDAVDGERLSMLLYGLPVEQREVVVLRALVGLTFAAIARSNGVPEGTVVSRYRYGIEKLRAALARGGYRDAPRPR